MDGVWCVLVHNARLLVFWLEFEKLPEFIVILFLNQVAGIVVEKRFEVFYRVDVNVRMFLQISEILILFVDFSAFYHSVKFFELNLIFDVLVMIVGVFVFGVNVFDS